MELHHRGAARAALVESPSHQPVVELALERFLDRAPGVQGPAGAVISSGLGGPDDALPAGIYQLSIPGPAENYCLTGDLDILDDLEILGDEEGTTVIVGDGSDRVLHASQTTLMLSNVTLTGGEAFG